MGDGIVAMPVGTPNSLLVEGSVKDACSVCGGAVWIAPSSLELMAHEPGRFVVVCWTCAARDIAEGESRVMLKLFPNQVTEIGEVLGSEEWKGLPGG